MDGSSGISSDKPVLPSMRWKALALVLLMQTLFFCVWLQRPIEVISDNVRYEVAGYNLAAGRGLSLPNSLAKDEEVRGWVCTRHPEACLSDTTYPVAIYAPGYSVFIAASYLLFGRSLPALVVEQLVLLWILFVLLEQMAARRLRYPGYLFVMAIAGTYPFIARTASAIQSDHLHVALYFAAFASLFVFPPGPVRGGLFGGLGAFAMLVRPYCMFVFPAVLLLPRLWRTSVGFWRERTVALVCLLLPLLAWTGRNAYWFGRFIPFTTNGVGITLYHTTMEWDGESQYDTQRQERWYGDLEEHLGADPMSYIGSRRALGEALERIRENPGQMVKRLAIHVPKSWVSLGTTGGGVSKAWPLLVTYLGGLVAVGVAGIWLKRRDPLWQALALGILCYWIVLIPIPADARRSLPLRLPMLLFAGVAVEAAWRRWSATRLALTRTRSSREI